MAVFDCFIFNDEFDMLEYRFSELFDAIDRFVIVEGNKNFANRPKPLHFKNNLARFQKYLSKVSHVMVDNYPTSDPMGMENYQRDCMMRALGTCKDDDVILLTDCDEIPTTAAIRDYRVHNGVMTLSMEFYYYNLQTKSPDKWNFPKILPFVLFKAIGPAKVRYIEGVPVIPDAGKHLSYFGGVNTIIKKLEDFSHQELNRPEFKNRAHIEKAIAEGTDLFGRNWVTFNKE